MKLTRLAVFNGGVLEMHIKDRPRTTYLLHNCTLTQHLHTYLITYYNNTILQQQHTTIHTPSTTLQLQQCSVHSVPVAEALVVLVLEGAAALLMRVAAVEDAVEVDEVDDTRLSWSQKRGRTRVCTQA